jgi:hypothetical protein
LPVFIQFQGGNPLEPWEEADNWELNHNTVEDWLPNADDFK